VDVRRRRIATTVIGGLLALATLPAVLASSAQLTAATRFASTTPGAAAPPSGEQYAVQVLDAAPIPPGAQPWTAPPPAILDEPSQSVGFSDLIDLHELYQVDEPAGSPQSGPLDSFVLARLPRGSRETGSGSTFGPSGDAGGFFFSLPTSGPNEYLAQLLYETTETGGGAYLLRVDAQVVWVPDRPSSEVIPVQVSAQLTGYTTISDMNNSSGPVSVQLGQAESVRLAVAVDALPPAPQTLCMENSLLYTITFSPLGGSGQTHVVSGWFCPKVVDVSVGAAQLPPLSDAGCSLLHLVISLLPAQAAGTRSAAANC
jgi:hypothetical protein